MAFPISLLSGFQAGAHSVKPVREVEGNRPHRATEPGREAALGYSLRDRARLTVETIEGDRVTISLSARSQLGAVSDGNTVAVAANSRSRIRTSVQGELNEAERADLAELSDALGADPAKLLEALSGLETLASFEYTQTQKVHAGLMFSLVG